MGGVFSSAEGPPESGGANVLNLARPVITVYCGKTGRVLAVVCAKPRVLLYVFLYWGVIATPGRQASEEAHMESVAVRSETRISGLAVSDGVVVARTCFLTSTGENAVPYYKIDSADVENEKARLLAALKQASGQLAKLVEEVKERIGAAQANIFVAQQMMIEDPIVHQEMNHLIQDELLNAETAIVKTLDAYDSRILAVDNEYIKERASDIGEMRRRLLDILRAEDADSITVRPKEVMEGEEMMIVVAKELTPSDTVTLDTERVAGFITERGGAASHAAILARAMSIPAVSGIRDVFGSIPHGQEVLLNGKTGEVILRPREETVAAYPRARRAPAVSAEVVGPLRGFKVMGNMSLVNELAGILKMQAEGIGLYRTEFECFAAGRMLTEDEQYERYAEVARAMKGLPFYIRLLDFGGDKPAPFLRIPEEDNPSLGYRGARLLLGEPEVLAPQARAIARASAHGPIHVMYPMIIHLEQFVKLREIFLDSVRGLPAGEIKHGVMFEVPSACLQASDILEEADFGSIGTNDLIQHLFAIDRNNDLVAPDYNPDHPVFWALLKEMAKAARMNGCPLTICGEIASQPQYIARILDLGISQVSVSPRFIGLSRSAAKRILATP